MVDWDLPIEAYHINGTVLAVTKSCGPDGDGDYGISPPINGRDCFKENGDRYKVKDGWRIRNTQPKSPPIPDDIAARAVGLVRRMSVRYPTGPLPDDYADARAILSDLEPVSVDLLAARECVVMAYEKMGRKDLAIQAHAGQMDNRLRVQAALAAIAKGRQMQKDGK